MTPFLNPPLSSPIRARFLPLGATAAQLVKANVLNHKAWFARNTRANDGAVTQSEGITVLETEREWLLAFPRFTESEIERKLDRLVARAFADKPERVVVWSVTPSRPRSLGAKLASRGFAWGWCPHWMALDLSSLSAEFPLPAFCELAVDEQEAWEAADLPYYNPATDAAFRRLLDQKPKRMWRFSVRQNGRIVAQTVLFVTTGAFGVGGIYNVGVVPSARQQGIGRAITAAACRFAEGLGCHYATLNAATHVYARIGFRSLGGGQTWWLHQKTLNAPPPTRCQIQFADAIGQADFSTLRGLFKHGLTPDLDAPLPNGSTPIELAIQAGKPKAAIWLSQHGASLEVVHAVDLGLRERIPQLLADTPSLANRRFGEGGRTPLHEAVARNDLPLVNLLLAAGADPSLQEGQFHADPLGWAHHFGRTEMVEILKAHLNS